MTQHAATVSSEGKMVVLSGITGFLGSHIAEGLLKEGYRVTGLKRTTSDTWRCSGFKQEITWINLDEEGWQQLVSEQKPAIIIHAAWGGVKAADRDNLREQLKNLDLLADLLQIAKVAGAEKFIGLGSQAEYGQLNSVVDEDHPLRPEIAYGIVKTMASLLIGQFCSHHQIDWYWLRLFSFFGEKEDANWFIPMIINKLLAGEPEITLSSCEQKYAYMYVGDMVKVILAITSQSKGDSPGIYNISAANALSLKEVILMLQDLIGQHNTLLKFGALPLRIGQSMHIEGSIIKFEKRIQKISYTPLQVALERTISFYR